MIAVDFFTKQDGKIVGFSMAGHAGFAPVGEDDIVCAAVSSAALLVINTITDVLRVSPRDVRALDGQISIEVELKNEAECRPWFQGLKLHLQNLEEQYPENIKVSYLEV